ncbi:tyrosine-type recombinase/integrase [Vibrio anguillarum]|uniref:tyrosine-type recombinase/integrase n=1 Tax=Vibrio anguillarum TaxID=55601 RepID=UPI00097E3759|nr:tyrosine-type recombinase/integrase [Vibrio anguillarum]MBF4284807.1 integrase [Vibrio anguillarum]MBF4290176.1 integrase [Vibrio anguillarum]MBF4340619.1 integrase [Vibrio anguillarum]MBF4358834.1 integrase [Vibrio anguillarum]MBF4378723.1 integrase [Vibrio anguillarum]
MKKNIPLITDPMILKQKVTEFSDTVCFEQFQHLTHWQYSKNSALAMTKDWNHFVTFCKIRCVTPLPGSTTAVRQFIETEARVRKYATIRRYMVTIGIIHHLLSMKDPTQNRLTQLSLFRLKGEKGDDAKQATPLTKKHLLALDIQLIHSPNKKDIRDLAIYYVMFECALKRSELKKLSTGQVLTVDGQMKIIVGNVDYYLSESASLALKKWLQLLNKESNIVFCSIDRHGNISNRSLNDASIFRILRHAGQRLGIFELKFSGQSTRVGAAQELAKQGYKTQDIQQFGRWLSPAMPAQYIGKLDIAESEQMKFKVIKPFD